MNKYEAAVLIIMTVFIFGGQTISTIYEAKAEMAKAKAGLVECPDGHRTYWAKECPKDPE